MKLNAAQIQSRRRQQYTPKAPRVKVDDVRRPVSAAPLTLDDARRLLTWLTPDQQVCVYDYCLHGLEKYGVPLTAETLKENAEHLAEEEMWDEVVDQYATGERQVADWR